MKTGQKSWSGSDLQSRRVSVGENWNWRLTRHAFEVAVDKSDIDDLLTNTLINNIKKTFHQRNC